MIAKKILFYLPERGNDYEKKLENCLVQLNNYLSNNGLEKKRIIKQTIFVDSNESTSFNQICTNCKDILGGFFSGQLPSAAFVSQPPEGDYEIALETTILMSEAKIYYKTVNELHYTILEKDEYKEINGACASSNKEKDINNQSEEVFEKIRAILDAEEMRFSDIVRQWNYIEKITEESYFERSTRQNYQQFNDVRSKYYDSAEWINGYPAATGIGMNCGGAAIEFTAAKADDNSKIIPIANPRQIDAHSYSGDVLVGAGSQRTTPKFERAKVITDGALTEMYVSGTAAILKEKTVELDSVEKQTKTTIENIEHLTSPENLQKCGVNPDISEIDLEYVRVYVKNREDIPKVKDICKNHYGNIPILYVQADVCRNDLLVEIEAYGVQ